MTKSLGIRAKRFEFKNRILHALHTIKYGDAKQITAAIGNKSAHTVRPKLNALHKAGRIYIADYKKKSRRGNYSKVYALRLNNEPDADKPEPYDPKQAARQIAKREKQRRLLNGEWGNENARKKSSDTDRPTASIDAI